MPRSLCIMSTQITIKPVLISHQETQRFLILGAVGRSKVIFNPSFGSALPRGAPVYVACYMYVLAYSIRMISTRLFAYWGAKHYALQPGSLFKRCMLKNRLFLQCNEQPLAPVVHRSTDCS